MFQKVTPRVFYNPESLTVQTKHYQKNDIGNRIQTSLNF